MSKLKLTDVEWGEFKIGKLFDVSNVKGKPVENYQSGNTPYVSTAGTNNAVVSFVEATENIITDSGVITVDPIKGICFYHDYDFVGRGFSGASVNVLRNKNLNKFSGQFICTAIQNTSMSKASYGYLFNSNRLRNGTILLPIICEGQPNWQFMEDYIKQEQQQQAQQVIDYYERKLVDLAGEVVGLDKVEWKTFCLGEVFDLITKGSKGLNHLEKGISDGISYVGATNRNNGVLDFVEQKESLIYSGNAIAFIRNGEGSMGYSVYKKEDFIASQDITVGYNENLNEYNAKFITTVADQVRGKYNFGYKRNQERLKRETLTLPADKNGNPDFQYMSDFVKKLELDKVQEVLEYIYIYISN